MPMLAILCQKFSNFATNFHFRTMSIVKIKDKTFQTLISENEIKQRVKMLADRINHDMKDKNPVFLSVLNGAFMFTADLLREVTIPSEVSFVKLASYQGVISTGKVREVIGLNVDIAGRTIVIVEDIVDTGHTMRRMIDTLLLQHPESIHICTLFVKPDKLEEKLNIEYAAFEIPNDFIVGYGLDYDQQGRNLKEVYQAVNKV